VKFIIRSVRPNVNTTKRRSYDRSVAGRERDDKVAYAGSGQGHARTGAGLRVRSGARPGSRNVLLPFLETPDRPLVPAVVTVTGRGCDATPTGSASTLTRRPGAGSPGAGPRGVRSAHRGGENRAARKVCARPPSGAGQSLARVDPTAGNAGRDTASAKGAAKFRGVVGLVGVQVGRALARTPRPPARADDRWDRVEEWEPLRRIVSVGGREPDGEGDAVAIDDQVVVVLGPRFAAVSGVEAGLLAPFWPARSGCPRWRGSSRWRRRRPTSSAASRAAVPRRPLPAGHAAAANRWRHFRSPALSAATATGSRCAGRRRCRRGRRGRGRGGDHPSAWAVP
jgi:hypothetical protein